MSDYRWLTRFYALCETIIFRKSLQQCRTAFIPDLPQTVLSVGEGDGRFSEALLKTKPLTQLTIIEPDAAMRAKGKRRSPKAHWQANWQGLGQMDTIVMNFVLDCCTEVEAQAMLLQAQNHLNPGGILIVGDFFPEETNPAWKRPFARVLVWVMYCFFHTLVGLAVKQLPPTRRLLERAGWRCQKQHTQWDGFIRAQWWEQAPTKKPAQEHSEPVPKSSLVSD